ncbi:hypothetical protein [[Clostridium] dakarense]|uniref:hypothetical protein n=1 Tax=Faecalimicrobium dakarense TaxID=1301100 RepID=UPI0012B5C3A8|nr:hypothetical protein [[Clostridium] dakarense]
MEKNFKQRAQFIGILGFIALDLYLILFSESLERIILSSISLIIFSGLSYSFKKNS